MWGGAYVSMQRDLSNGVTNWGPAGSPTTVDIKRTGILRGLRILTDGTATFTPGTGTIARDVMGPWNVYSQIVVTPNQQAPVRRTSGYGNFIDYFMRSPERANITPDTVLASETSADPLADIYSGSSTTSGDWRFYFDVPIAQMIRSLGTEIGLWPLENPAVQLQFQFTPAGSTAASPFSIASSVATQAPYLVTGNATAVVASPQIDLRRFLWEVPARAEDNPPYTFVTTLLEETPQSGNPSGAQLSEWKAMPLSGIILRLACFILDGATNQGVAESKLTGSNAFTLLFGADTQKFSETGQAAHARMSDYYGALPPQGVFIWDFLGKDLTLADVLDTYTIPEIRLDMNFSSTLGAGSFIRIIRQMLVPLEIQAA